MTEDSDQASVFGDLSSPSPFSAASATDDGFFFFTRDDFQNQEDSSKPSPDPSPGPGPTLTRTFSSSLAGSSGSLSPSWDEKRASTLFGTLPRKGRRASVRRHILKFIPGLNRSVEEEELGKNTQAATQVAS